MPSEDTIYALSSGQGRAGVAVVRISGPAAGEVMTSLVGARLEPRKATRADLRSRDTAELLDRALILWFPGPRSFTGEDVLELHVHGGPAVLAGTLDAIAACPGTRMAEPGEFTRRAFLNGKIDLTEAEGLGDLIAAQTSVQRRLALRQSAGELRRLYDDWRARLIAALAVVEAGLDFMDEADVPPEVASRASPQVEALLAGIRSHLDDDQRGEIVREGFRVVLAGPPNVGKSSLLNALARRPAAIVSEEPGTTRDIIEVWIELAGLPVAICDTAGLREARGAIEREGMRRTLERASDADLVLWVMDASDPDRELPEALSRMRDRVQPVLNKIDLLKPGRCLGFAGATPRVSAVSGHGIDGLITRITAIARERVGEGEAPTLTRRRHREQLEAACGALAAFIAGDKAALELRAEDLRQAANAIGRVTGRVDVEDVLDQIFAAFCIGK